ncbi:hypothetical protein NDU88_003684 [Pleurodeles waltl]|uniref:Uncharacterized protein n=1 Tax=Pleurodeles waltl TaxID=8319 RepID=A0AAV7W6S9_PLEWA|nr:hypothetical protein NDU88_003684 [Pleurodeles waltl]
MGAPSGLVYVNVISSDVGARSLLWRFWSGLLGAFRGGGFMLLGGDWIIGYSLRLSWLSAQFAPPFQLSSLRSPGGWTLGFTGSGLQSRSRLRMDLACSPRVPVNTASSQLCRDGGSQWALSPLGAWHLSVPPSSALDFRASGLRTDTFTPLLLASL